jgi:hypothetical protein
MRSKKGATKILAIVMLLIIMATFITASTTGYEVVAQRLRSKFTSTPIKVLSDLDLDGNEIKELYQTQMLTAGVLGSDLTTSSKSFKYVAPFDFTIKKFRVAVDVAPTGTAEILCDVNLNGTTIFTDQDYRLAVHSGEVIYTYTPAAAEIAADSVEVSVSAGDVIQLDLDQVGNTTAGQGLTVMIEYETD